MHALFDGIDSQKKHLNCQTGMGDLKGVWADFSE